MSSYFFKSDSSSDTGESLNLVPIPVLILLSGVDSESNARIFIFLTITLRFRFREYLRSSTIPSLSKHKLFQSLVLRRDWTKCLGVFIPRWDNRSYSISSSRQYTKIYFWWVTYTHARKQQQIAKYSAGFQFVTSILGYFKVSGGSSECRRYSSIPEEKRLNRTRDRFLFSSFKGDFLKVRRQNPDLDWKIHWFTSIEFFIGAWLCKNTQDNVCNYCSVFVLHSQQQNFKHKYVWGR